MRLWLCPPIDDEKEVTLVRSHGLPNKNEFEWYGDSASDFESGFTMHNSIAEELFGIDAGSLKDPVQVQLIGISGHRIVIGMER